MYCMHSKTWMVECRGDGRRSLFWSHPIFASGILLTPLCSALLCSSLLLFVPLLSAHLLSVLLLSAPFLSSLLLSAPLRSSLLCSSPLLSSPLCSRLDPYCVWFASMSSLSPICPSTLESQKQYTRPRAKIHFSTHPYLPGARVGGWRDGWMEGRRGLRMWCTMLKAFLKCQCGLSGARGCHAGWGGRESCENCWHLLLYGVGSLIWAKAKVKQLTLFKQLVLPIQ